MTSDFVFKSANAMHRALVKVSFGRIGWKAGALPMVELTTIGRKSGQPHSVMLASPVQEGDTWVVVASRNGDDQNPAWIYNLREHPDVEVSMRGRPKQPMRARIAGPEERARLWPLATKANKAYIGYQEKTDREIPVVLLEPR